MVVLLYRLEHLHELLLVFAVLIKQLSVLALDAEDLVADDF